MLSLKHDKKCSQYCEKFQNSNSNNCENFQQILKALFLEMCDAKGLDMFLDVERWPESLLNYISLNWIHLVLIKVSFTYLINKKISGKKFYLNLTAKKEVVLWHALLLPEKYNPISYWRNLLLIWRLSHIWPITEVNSRKCFCELFKGRNQWLYSSLSKKSKILCSKVLP